MTPQHRADLAAAEALIRYGYADYAATILATCPQEPARTALAALRAGDVGEAERHVSNALAGLGEASTGREAE